MNDKILEQRVEEIVNQTKIIDIHTHLFGPEFGDLFLYGIDKLLTYHYLIAEYFTYEKDLTPEEFYKFSVEKQAELVWNKIFIENTPVSEAARGVVTVLSKLGISVKEKNLNKIREYFNNIDLDKYIELVFKTANIKYVVMTNNPFNEKERKIWLSGKIRHNKFKTALRIDDLLFDFKKVISVLSKEGMDINDSFDKKTVDNIKKFFSKWIKLINPLYVMCSVPPDFQYPSKDEFVNKVLDEILMPIIKKYNLPFALMFGVRRQVNPSIKLAGDAVGRSDTDTILNLVKNNPDVKFLMTFLSRENIHETAVFARKFNNLMLFGCWWFTNIPYLIDEIVRIRMELVGLNFIPQHSDSRVFEQLIYKWEHFKSILIKILAEKYNDLIARGWYITDNEIKRDVENLLGGRFESFLELNGS